MGRSYGDVCLNPGGTIWRTTGLDHFISLDENSGVLTCEAGVVLRDIQHLVIPRGWSLPVTPGTQLVTVGGAIANDVHGKNHHVYGTFGDHVRRIKIVRTDGTEIDCGPDLQPDWFAATVGGIGLTGLITEAQIQLRRIPGPWFETETVPFSNLDEFFSLSSESDAEWENSVSWIDCVASDGRGLFMRGNPVSVTDRKQPHGRSIPMPLVPPISLVNQVSLHAFNAAYFQINRRNSGKKLTHYEPFLYPLDNIVDWNRMYGPHGFYQYQSVVPIETGREATAAMMREIAASGQGSFLAVLKTFGQRIPKGMLSFPRPGVTLALDFPNLGDRSLKLFDRLDSIVRNAGGRIYLAKDARMSRGMFEAGYPRIEEFLNFRDPGMSSAMSRRLLGN
ncbi:putative decaprenylphosphoryl-beta-D-ribose oxidase [mine drainage metagenome]|uniref:Putative decaprenylphosphoryl-beta-D-ribose oxidase n=1 Tax=mine drainage metagenome TaxID=410659 RepID=A0A1J5PJ76_9ZZZZ